MKRKILYGLAGIAAAGCVMVFAAAGPSGRDFRIGSSMEVLMNMFRDVSLFYVDSVPPERLLRDAAQGMTKNLDPYTEFLPEEDMAEFEIMARGKYGGIGAVIRQKGDWVIIARPYENFPADKAGLRTGDKILEIDGQSARGWDVTRVSGKLKGDPGTTVRVRVEKIATGAEELFTIRRERIVMSGVPYHGYVSGGIGYIQYTEFTEDSSDDLRRALDDLKKNGPLRGLILDLRSNGGGILQEAVKSMSFFVPKGTEVVSMRGRYAQTNKVFHTEHEPVDLELPVAVLVNSASASAAEIVAGAFQDLDRGVLLGQRTFGKGLVQSTRPLGYNAFLKITTARYYTPSGRCIQAIDYAHRNEDGSVAFVPDSLVREFATRAGRRVFDGGGVMPDVRMEPDYASRFMMILYTKGYIEDFVDVWMRRNPQPVDLATFRLPESDYSGFIAFMEDKDIEFESETKRALAALRENAAKERYLDRIADDLDRIGKSLRDDKRSNLELYRRELSEMIEEEIVVRQHYMRGQTRFRLQRDREVDAAVELLRDPQRFRTIVTSQDTERK